MIDAARDFASVLRANTPGDDAALAELIEADGRQRLARGEPVDLERYEAAVPDLLQRQDPLDAAIDVTLRSLSGSSRLTPHAVDELIRRCPQLKETIREVAMLNAAIWSTTGLHANVAPANSSPPKPLPCDFGPHMNSGTGGSATPQRRYQLQQLLGAGGFGQVYLALDRQLSEEGHTAMVAIKILVSGTQSPSARQRMIEEATKVRRISHPNVVVVIDRGVTEQNEDFIVYEYVDGGDLTAIVNARPLLPLREAAALMAKIARGVHAAHSASVIHCDLKPSNIMLTAAREPKVADFGIAVRSEQTPKRQNVESSKGPADRQPLNIDDSTFRRSDACDVSHRPIGSIAFISPEQFRVETDGLSIPSDVYALGGIFFLLLTGQLPNGASLEEIARNHDPERGRTTAPAVRSLRPEVDRDLEAICRRAMAVQVDRRYNSAATFAEDLEHWLNREPISWTKPGAWRVLRLWSRRKPALAVSVALIIVLGITGSIVAIRLAAIANQNALDAALAQLRYDWEKSARERTRAIASNFANALKPTLGDYRLSTEALAKIWALEYAYGPKVLGLPEENAELWKNRIANIRNLVQSARAEGRGDQFETMLWESALAFWLVNDKDYTEAEPLIAMNLEKWSRILAEDDPWLNDLRSMSHCAAVNRLKDQMTSGSASIDESRRRELTGLEAALLAACDQLPPNHRGTPMHYMLLAGLVDLYGQTLLNQADRAEAIAAEIKQLLGKKPPPKPQGG